MIINYLKSLLLTFGKPNEVVRRSQFRTLYNKKQYRLFAFWDKTDKKVTIVVCTHGIVKKTQKTPKKEIERATELMNKYFNEKQ